MLLNIRKLTPFPSKEKVIPAVGHKYINGRTNFRMPSALRQYRIFWHSQACLIKLSIIRFVQQSGAPDFTYKGLFVIYQFKGNKKK